MGIIMHKGISYGGGSDVEANPTGSATDDLSKIGIDGTIYDVMDADAVHGADVGVASGVASLDSNGKVPSGQLPSYVDDVINGYFANSKFYSDPTVGGYYYGGAFYYDADHENLILAETGRFYYNYPTSAFYIYNGSAYVTTSDTPDEITGEDGKIYVDLNTNKTYRWSGVAFVEISPSLSLGITANTAYYGDKGKEAYDHATDSDKVGQTATGFYKVGATSDGHIAELTAVQKSDITDLGIPDSSDIPTVNNATISIQKNGAAVDSFTVNQSTNKTVNIIMDKSDVGLGNVPNVSTDNQTPTVTTASTRANLASGDTLKTIIGKIKKYFADLKTVAFTGSYNDLTDKPTIPSGQVQSDWTQTTTTAVDYIKNKPSLATVATSGSYNDLSNKPTIPSVGNGTITIQKNSTTVDTFTTNQSSAKTINITVAKADVGLDNVPNVTTDNQTPTVTEASTRANLASGDTLKTIIGKIKKFFSDLKTVAFTGSYSDLTDKPTIPSAQVNSDWNASSGVAQILNKPTIPAAQIQSDWNQTTTTEADYIKNKPTISDTKVTQSNTTTNSYRRVILSNSANDTSETSTTRKSGKLTFNPSTGDLKTVSLNGVTVGSTPEFTDTQSDWNVTDTSSKAYIKNKPTIPGVTGVKGNSESSYRTGNVNITKANIGLGNVDNTSDSSKNVNSAKYLNYTQSTSQGSVTVPCSVEGSLTDNDDKIPNSAAVISYLSDNYCPKTPTVIALTDITWKVTYNANYTFFYKIGRVVYFQIYFGGNVTTNTEVAVLPNSIKPFANQNWYPIMNNLGGNFYGRLNIQSSGSVSTLCSTTVNYGYASGFYIAAT